MTPRNTRSAVKDETTIAAIMLLLSPPSFFFLGTSTPNGFSDCPSFGCRVYGSLSIAEISEDAEGGEGGRPERSRNPQDEEAH